jgi:predicted metal-dependent enzyme (double-stranded beta helix superfamily)
MQGLLGEERREAVLRSLRTDEGTLSQDYLAAARGVLRELVAVPELVQSLPLARKPGCYARNLLAGDDEVSVWAMVWGEDSATSIHDHHCSCCFGVISGTVTETWYRAVDATRAVPTGEQRRDAGYVACMLPSGPNIHRMRNAGPGDAISIHIYGFDHRVHASSIETEYTAVGEWSAPLQPVREQALHLRG